MGPASDDCRGAGGYEPSAAQVAEWKKAAEPLAQTWADNVKKAGGDPDVIMKDLKAELAKFKAAY